MCFLLSKDNFFARFAWKKFMKYSGEIFKDFSGRIFRYLRIKENASIKYLKINFNHYSTLLHNWFIFSNPDYHKIPSNWFHFPIKICIEKSLNNSSNFKPLTRVKCNAKWFFITAYVSHNSSTLYDSNSFIFVRFSVFYNILL